MPTAFLRKLVCEGTVRGPVVSGPEVRGHMGASPVTGNHARTDSRLMHLQPISLMQLLSISLTQPKSVREV